MKHLLSCFISLVFLLDVSDSKAQNITGSWYGYSNGEYMELNVQQKGNDLCGYTHDYVLDDSSSYCYANFEGRFDPSKQIYYIGGTYFIANSGGHVLMRLILWQDKSEPRSWLRGKVFIQSQLMSIFGMGGDEILFKKKSSIPRSFKGREAPCFPQTVKKEIPAKKEPVKNNPPKKDPERPGKPLPVNPALLDTTKIQPEKKEVPKQIIQPPAAIEQLMAARKQTEQSRISIDVDHINLKIYDNGTVDNDTVSVFYNGRLLLSHKRLSEKAIELNIKLDEGVTQHKITLFADNLGSIPPNTALVVVTAGTKRYELRSSASLEENAVLLFDYVPK